MTIGSLAQCVTIAVLASASMPWQTRAAEISVAVDGTSLTITGPIQEWDHCRAALLLASHPGIRQARINSHGGSAWAGAYLGRLFGWAGLEAVVPKGAVAESAAGVAVIGAPQRVIEGRVGLHGPWLGQPDRLPMAGTILAETAAEMASVLKLGGMPPGPVDRAMATGRDRLYLIDKVTMASFHHHGQPDPGKITRVAEVCRSVLFPTPDLRADADASARIQPQSE